DRYPIVEIMGQTPEIPEENQWALFLRNHDELTLEMVTDEERDFMYRAYARDPTMRINLGIRRRLAPLCGNDRRVIELMNGLLFSLPGTPVVYYGDEIGMGDNIYLGDRNGVRTPMQWSADRNAGFSRANPQRLYLPVIIDPEYHAEAINVEAQQNNPRSLLWWMRRMIAQRQRTQVFGRGDIRFLTPDNPKVLAFVRTLEAEEEGADPERVLVVANLSRHAQACELDLSDLAGLHLVELFGRSTFPPVTDQPYVLTLGPHQFHWFGIEREPSRMTLSKMHVPGAAGGVGTPPALPSVTVSGDWRALLRGRGAERLAAVLPDVLRRQRWFGGKARTLRSVHLVEAIGIAPADVEGPADVQLAVVEVEYVDGEPETYLLPLAFHEGPAEEVGDAALASVVGRGAGASGTLVDALHDPDAQLLLARTVLAGDEHAAGAGVLVGRPRPGVTDDPDETLTGVHPHRLLGEQSNTSVVYGDRYLLKLLRRLEAGESPDVEVGGFLAEQAGVAHVPTLVGTLDRVDEHGRARTVAVLHRWVPNEGDLWGVTLDELERFAERVLTDPPTGRPAPGRAPSALVMAARELPESVHESIGWYLAAAELLGQRTAEVHAALASGTAPAFEPQPFTALWQRSLYQSIRNAVRKGLQAARRGARTLDDPDAVAAIRALSEREDEVLSRLRALSDIRMEALRTRTHGDLHLGQVLWTGRDHVLIDFEGEPARPLGERRLKRSPLRDVAGMLRSFQYATASTLEDQRERGVVAHGSEAEATLARWLDWWLRWVEAAFLHGYLTHAEGHGFLPDDPLHTAVLLDAFLLEKAVYELGYELNNRPTWVHIPLAGIADVLDHAGG
ncbi:MAG: putative maltokinase, partial [Actinomycetes bacterium]